MADNFQDAGVIMRVRELGSFERDVGKSNKAIETLGESAENVGNEFSKLGDKTKGLSARIQDNLKSAGESMKSLGSRMQDVGGSMTKSITLPMAGIGAAVVKLGTDINAAMADVASLGLAPERVLELKNNVQETAISVGKNTGDIADGLYQVVSAFGDTADTAKILDINARAAAAGLSTTEEAIALTSAVTKGYGDTSAEAVQHAADLAFQTVKMGQTTFPELASSMGKVIPLASSLGVTQEELFAQMATLTGVTGNTAEVTTQLRATFQAIIKPSTDMASAISGIAQQLDEQGKLAAGPLVDAWKSAREQFRGSSRNLSEMTSQLVQLESQMAAGKSGADELKQALKEERFELKQQVSALEDQIHATDTTTKAGQAQEAQLQGQIRALERASDARQLEIEGQLLALSGSENLEGQYKALKAEIKTQEKAVDDNREAMEQSAAALGTAVVESIGLNDTLSLLTGTAEGNTDQLGKMFGSVESLNAVLALSEGQSEALTEKYGKMTEATGASEEAFKAQTEGINNAGFTMAQLAVKAQVLAERLFDGVAPALASVLEIVEPVIDRVIELANRFAAMDERQQKNIITLAAVVAAAGPVISILGTLITTVGSVVTISGTVVGSLGGVAAAIGALSNPIGLSIVAVAGLALAWKTDFLGIQTATKAAVADMSKAFSRLSENTSSTWRTWTSDLSRSWDRFSFDIGSATNSFVRDSLANFRSFQRDARPIFDRFKNEALLNFQPRDWKAAGRDAIEGLRSGISSMASSVTSAIGNIASGIVSEFRRLLRMRSPSQVFADLGADMMRGMIGGIESMRGAVQNSIDHAVNSIVATAENAQEAFSNIFSTAGATERFASAIAKRYEENVSEPLEKVLEARREAAGELRVREAGLNLFESLQQMMAGGTTNIAKWSVDATAMAKGLSTFARAFNLAPELFERMGLSKGDISGLAGTDIAAFIERLAPVIRQTKNELGNIGVGAANTYVDAQQQRLTVERELMQLVQKQKEEREKLLQIERQQEQLSFLREQADFVQFLRKSGLNPKDFLQDVTLGLDANLGDLVRVMGDALTAVVQQANQALTGDLSMIQSGGQSGTSVPGTVTGGGALPSRTLHTITRGLMQNIGTALADWAKGKQQFTGGFTFAREAGESILTSVYSGMANVLDTGIDENSPQMMAFHSIWQKLIENANKPISDAANMALQFAQQTMPEIHQEMSRAFKFGETSFEKLVFGLGESLDDILPERSLEFFYETMLGLESMQTALPAAGGGGSTTINNTPTLQTGDINNGMDMAGMEAWFRQLIRDELGGP